MLGVFFGWGGVCLVWGGLWLGWWLVLGCCGGGLVCWCFFWVGWLVVCLGWLGGWWVVGLVVGGVVVVVLVWVAFGLVCGVLRGLLVCFVCWLGLGVRCCWGGLVLVLGGLGVFWWGVGFWVVSGCVVGWVGGVVGFCGCWLV
ncbi:hypothetical protein, partial [Neisseria sp. P0019.S002]|uniref:hypothetical protein n=1 Tax=Neisseria sp. P0019.S002 TaxID=3436798 RepID=UPI003F7F117C